MLKWMMLFKELALYFAWNFFCHTLADFLGVFLKSVSFKRRTGLDFGFFIQISVF